MTAYFSPAEKVSDLCVLEPAKLSTLTPSQQTVMTGQSFTFDVALVATEATDLTLMLDASDRTAFEMPATVTIRAGQKHASFVARAVRPGNFDISASMADAKVVTSIRVAPLGS